ncbi:MAG: elongation factor Ts [Deltaproteobacteria bacterium]|nr:elongation factor Ts [Deltaproteobacteria bacterium]
MAVTAAQVKELREKTGAGMMDCKAALDSSGGDFEGAIRYLREKGLATAAKRAGKVAAEGVILARLVSPTEGVMIELNCETDFVAKTPQFQDLAGQLLGAFAGRGEIDGLRAAADLDLAAIKVAGGKAVADVVAESIASMGESIVLRRVARVSLKAGEGSIGSYVHAGGKIGVLVEAKSAASGAAASEVEKLLRDVAMQVAAANPRHVKRDEVAAADVEREREIYAAQAATTGKPAPVIERIVQGKVEKFFAEVCLVEQEFIRDPSTTVGKLVAATSKTAGAPIEITRFVRLQLGESSGEA